MNNALQIKSDTLTILLCNRIHEHLKVKDRALKIAKTCKVVRDNTHDQFMYALCCKIITWANGRQYLKVLDKINLTENNYMREYK